MSKAHAIVLLESMINGDIPSILGPLVARRYSHYLRGTAPSDIARLEFGRDQLATVLFALSQALKPEKYYSHVVMDNEMYVVLPGAFVRINRGDRESLERAVALAISYKVSPAHTTFKAMFEFDHPEMHDIQEVDW